MGKPSPNSCDMASYGPIKEADLVLSIVRICRCSSVVELLICNQRVVGSIPTAGSNASLNGPGPVRQLKLLNVGTTFIEFSLRGVHRGIARIAPVVRPP